MKTCLNCKYEPNWSAWTGGKYSRQHGECKWDVKQLPKLPAIMYVQGKSVVRYSDNSGIPTGCDTWEPKEKGAK